MEGHHHTIRHIAVIMDGNGRWAKQQGHPRSFGHVKGVQRAQDLARECARMNIHALTLYAFSTENWLRPKAEIDFLMKILKRYLVTERKEILNNNIRFQSIGCRKQLPEDAIEQINSLEKESKKNTGMILSLALSYGSRQEITSSVQAIAEKIQSGALTPREITEKNIEESLFTHALPNLDLLIRTGGEQRISNFLLWQLAYAELYFTDVCWPDFTTDELQKALSSFANRERRFGNLPQTTSTTQPNSTQPTHTQP